MLTAKTKLHNINLWKGGNVSTDGNKRERITIRLTKRYLDLLNTLIDKGVYNSRNEAIRDALRIMYEYHGLKVAPEKKPAGKTEDSVA
jgi:Arc/MetJ-type ribon-helix-helix transcriptional regulator